MLVLLVRGKVLLVDEDSDVTSLGMVTVLTRVVVVVVVQSLTAALSMRK